MALKRGHLEISLLLLGKSEFALFNLIFIVEASDHFSISLYF